MVSSVGVDVEEVDKFKSGGSNFLSLLFTKREKVYCMARKEPFIHFAGKFCAKEAVIKAIGRAVPIREIEILNSSSGKVSVFLKGKRQENILCSISHTDKIAVAFVVIENLFQ